MHPRSSWPASAEALDPAYRECLAATAALTGAEGLTTCPLAYTRLPWVGTAAQAYDDREKGCLGDVHGAPSAVLVEAVRAVGAGVRAFEAHCAERRRREDEERRSGRE